MQLHGNTNINLSKQKKKKQKPDLEIRASPKLSPTILHSSSRSQHSFHSAIACGCFTQPSTTTTITGQALISYQP